jgi:hypothetical protein
MTELRRLCQTLLNGTPDRSDLQWAECFLRAALAQAAETEGAPPGAPWEPPNLPASGNPASRRLVLQTLAPALLLDGIWLARAAWPATGHREPECHLLELYCRIVGLDDPAGSPPVHFRASLIAAGVHLPSLDSPAFFRDPRFPDSALRLSAQHLCLLHRPRTFFPELLGYTLAHASRKPAWWDGEPALEDEAGYLALAAVEAYPDRHVHEERIRAGWNLYRRGFEALMRDIGGLLTRRFTAEDAMAEIVRSKLPYAVGYHGRIRLQGRSLDQWLAESAADPRPLLKALRASPRVDPACPAGSRLIRAMDFGGPMFGVFEPRERQACLKWIGHPEGRIAFFPRAGGEPGWTPETENPSLLTPSPQPAPSSQVFPDQGGTVATRLLYSALLRAESPADCPPAADAFVLRILRRTRGLSPLQPAHRRFFPYSPEAFNARIRALHRREIERYRPLAGAPRISRDFCRWTALQLAPAILVDGAWLAGIATAAEKLDDIGRHLLKIYAEELGSGRPDRNHPNVYRRLLESLDFGLPAFDGEEFAHDPRFLDAAFDIPVYILAMGQLSDRYFPEVLGLNLAVELSGLGAGYMQVAEILKYHGIDSTIIQLHLSIDNLASGHAARAREAIALYLEEVRRRGGAKAVEAQWRRIWTGYLSLNVAAFGLAIRLIIRHFSRSAADAILALLRNPIAR